MRPGDGEPPVPLAAGVPVVALVGSCMNCGKTAAACTLVRQLSHEGWTVDGLKATGVSLRRDVLAHLGWRGRIRSVLRRPRRWS